MSTLAGHLETLKIVYAISQYLVLTLPNLTGVSFYCHARFKLGWATVSLPQRPLLSNPPTLTPFHFSC